MIRWFFLLLACAGIGVFSPPAAAETVRVVADAWCPYNCEPGSAAPGIIIEIAQEALKKHDIDLQYTLLPWARAIEETRDGQHDAIVGAAHGDAPDFIFPAQRQAGSVTAFFTKAGSQWRYKSLSSLDAIALGVIADYSYNEEIDSYIRLNKRDFKRIQQAFGEEALAVNVRKLLNNRIGAIVEEKNVMDYFLASTNQQSLVAPAGDLPVTPDQDLFIAFSPKNPKAKTYAEMITQETVAMEKDGRLDALLKKYGLTGIPEDQQEDAP